MLVRGHHRGVNLADDSVLVDDIGYSSGDDAQRFRDGKQFPQRAVGVTNEREVEAILLGKAKVRLIGITTDSDDFSTGINELRVGVAKCTCFFGANCGAVLRIRPQAHKQAPLTRGQEAEGGRQDGGGRHPGDRGSRSSGAGGGGALLGTATSTCSLYVTDNTLYNLRVVASKH